MRAVISSLIIGLFTAALFFMATSAVEPADSISALSATVLPVSGSPAPVGRVSDEGRVVILAVDRLAIEDINEKYMPELRRLAEISAIALMNCGTAGTGTPENTYATIGAGARVLATDSSSSGYAVDDKTDTGKAGADYFSRTGIAFPKGALVQTSIVQIIKMNEKLPDTVQPGAMGAALRAAGIKTAAIGNSDSRALGPGRQILSVVMDDKGIVDYGVIGPVLTKEDPLFVGGIRTDYDMMLACFDGLPQDARVVVMEAGDLERLEGEVDKVFENVIKKQRLESLKSFDHFLGELLKRLDLSRDLLIVVSPTPNSKMVEGSYMTPIFMAGPGIRQGFLVSPNTKRAGIVNNTNIAPTILFALGQEIPPVISGQPMQYFKGKNQVQLLCAMLKQLSLTYNARLPMSRGYIISQLILLGLTLYLIFRKNSSWAVFVKPFLLAVMAVPAAYLLLTLLPQSSIPLLAAELILVTSLIVIVALVLYRQIHIHPFIIICFTTAILILVDVVSGSQLQRASVMGYDPIIGARFYGIGNEYMGFLIGSVIIGMVSLLTNLQISKKVLNLFAVTLFCFVIFVIGAPFFGANAGGTIAAATAFFTTLAMIFGISVNLRIVTFIGVLVLAVISSITILDVNRGMEAQSHIGRAAAMLFSGNWGGIIDIISRKMEVNVRLIKYTIWSRIFLASIGILALLFYRPVGEMAALKKRYPFMYKGFVGVIIGSVAAFVFNDSGVVAAATTMVFGAPPLIYLILERER